MHRYHLIAIFDNKFRRLQECGSVASISCEKVFSGLRASTIIERKNYLFRSDFMMKTSTFIIAITVMASLVSCGTRQQQRTQKTIPTVSTVVIDSSAMSGFAKEYVGVVDDSFTTRLSFAVPGNVKTVCVREGQRVNAGDVVAELDDRTARNAYNAAKSALERVKDGYDRAKMVYDKGSLPEVKWIEICSQLTQAESLFDVALKNLEDCVLVSPVSGVVSGVSVEQGMNVSAYAPVLSLMDIDRLEVEIKVPENEIPFVSCGSRVSVSVPAVDADGLEGRVVSVGVVGDVLSHSYKVRLSVESCPGLMPGMVCRVSMLDSPLGTNGFAVPGRAVSLSNDGRRYVWIVDDGTVTRRYVDVDGLSKTGVIVSGGLGVGDEVVVDGGFRISEGMKVVVR